MQIDSSSAAGSAEYSVLENKSSNGWSKSWSSLTKNKVQAGGAGSVLLFLPVPCSRRMFIASHGLYEPESCSFWTPFSVSFSLELCNCCESSPSHCDQTPPLLSQGLLQCIDKYRVTSDFKAFRTWYALSLLCFLESIMSLSSSNASSLRCFCDLPTC